jgi:hypothetical protein
MRLRCVTHFRRVEQKVMRRSIPRRHCGASTNPISTGSESIDIAGVYAGQGNNDKAFAWLEKAYEAREGIPLSLIKI